MKHALSRWIGFLLFLPLITLLAAPGLAQGPCSPGPLESEGFVTVQGSRLMLDGQPFHVRGANYGGGRYIQQFPIASFPTGPEEVYGGTYYLDASQFDPEAIEGELAFHRYEMGSTAIRIFFGTVAQAIDPGLRDRFVEFLCLARRQGIRVHIAWLVAVPTEAQFPAAVAGATTFFQSILPFLEDEPAVLAHEVGNEILSYYGTLESRERTLRFQRALIGVIRSLDANHLVTGGGVSVGGEALPAPEFQWLYIDGPAQPPVRLEQLVDYIAPHAYDFTVFPGEFQAWVARLRQATTKPIVLGEFGYGAIPDTELNKTAYEGPQRDYFAQMEQALRQVCRTGCPAGSVVGLDGWMPWLPFPVIDLYPGFFTKEIHAHFPWPYILDDVSGRKIHYRDKWDLFYHPDPVVGSPLKPLAAGLLLRKALTAPFDFVGEGTSDVAIFRPSTGEWLTTAGVSYTLGGVGDLPVAADYDGDGRLDPAVFRPGTGEWFVRTNRAVSFGQSADVPVPADYDGDGEAEIAVYRRSDATYHIRLAGADVVRPLGIPGDVPVPADYDGDGATDLGIYRPTTGRWTAIQLDGSPLFADKSWGALGDVPVPGDYDGDGVANLAVFRPSSSHWLVDSGLNVAFGAPGDVLVPADYTGDGVTDIAVYRPSTGEWFLRTLGTIDLGGQAEDIPLPRRQF